MDRALSYRLREVASLGWDAGAAPEGACRDPQTEPPDLGVREGVAEGLALGATLEGEREKLRADGRKDGALLKPPPEKPPRAEAASTRTRPRARARARPLPPVRGKDSFREMLFIAIIPAASR